MNNIQDRPIVDPHNPRRNFMPTAPVIEGVEEFGSWLEHREIVVQELCPFGALESLYAERVAIYLWRLDRVIGFENAANRVEIEAGSTIRLDESDRVSKRSVIPDQPTLQGIIRYEAHLDRCLAHTMAELRRLQNERRQGLRDAIPGGGGVDRAGVDQNQDEDGSPGGSPTQKSSPMRLGTAIPQAGSPSQAVSPSREIKSSEMSIPGGGGVDRFGVDQNQDEAGSPGGSPSQKSSPMQMVSPMQTVTPMRLDSSAADQNNRKAGSPGGSPTQKSSPMQMVSPMRMGSPIRGETSNQTGMSAQDQNVLKDGSNGGSPSQTGSPSRTVSPSQKSTPIRTEARNQRNSTSRKYVASKRASPIPKTPPLLASITNRRRLEEYTLGQIFEPKLGSATLDFAMIPKPTTFA